MNDEWSECNKAMQNQIKKRDTYPIGIETLFDLRNRLMHTMLSFSDELRREDFNTLPFVNADGNHNATIAWTLWHVFRIEDIVAHTLIQGDEQIFFADDYQRRINTPIITTGNELEKQQLIAFSEQLNLKELYSYGLEVKESTEKIIRALPFDALKRKIGNDRKACLKSLNVVSKSKDVIWLIDYWCGKDIRGLIQMPFSRHWIMHTEASLRIKNKIRP